MDTKKFFRGLACALLTLLFGACSSEVFPECDPQLQAGTADTPVPCLKRKLDDIRFQAVVGNTDDIAEKISINLKTEDFSDGETRCFRDPYLHWSFKNDTVVLVGAKNPSIETATKVVIGQVCADLRDGEQSNAVCLARIDIPAIIKRYKNEINEKKKMLNDQSNKIYIRLFGQVGVPDRQLAGTNYQSFVQLKSSDDLIQRNIGSKEQYSMAFSITNVDTAKSKLDINYVAYCKRPSNTNFQDLGVSLKSLEIQFVKKPMTEN